MVDEIEETGIVKNPDDVSTRSAGRMQRFNLAQKTDENGQRYVTLPCLEPLDFYYNPDNYYR